MLVPLRADPLTNGGQQVSVTKWHSAKCRPQCTAGAWYSTQNLAGNCHFLVVNHQRLTNHLELAGHCRRRTGRFPLLVIQLYEKTSSSTRVFWLGCWCCLYGTRTPPPPGRALLRSLFPLFPVPQPPMSGIRSMLTSKAPPNCRPT